MLGSVCDGLCSGQKVLGEGLRSLAWNDLLEELGPVHFPCVPFFFLAPFLSSGKCCVMTFGVCPLTLLTSKPGTPSLCRGLVSQGVRILGRQAHKMVQ